MWNTTISDHDNVYVLILGTKAPIQSFGKCPTVVYSEPCQWSYLAKIINDFKALTIYAKSFILYVARFWIRLYPISFWSVVFAEIDWFRKFLTSARFHKDHGALNNKKFKYFLKFELNEIYWLFSYLTNTLAICPLLLQLLVREYYRMTEVRPEYTSMLLIQMQRHIQIGFRSYPTCSEDWVVKERMWSVNIK